MNVKKKALLVGICDSKTPTKDYPKLKGSHDDVRSLRELLIQCYGYKAEDITMLLDGVPGCAEPTRDNILSAIKSLVKDARAGDHFCFHYCGHSTQVINRTLTEDDGMDECIVPYDGEGKIILDNELNEHLVKPLPAGSYLVAVLDTCHSGTLLDLKHGQCNHNQVHIPWISRGKTVNEEPRRVRVPVRRNGGIFSSARAATTSRTSSRLLAQRDEINMNLICRSPAHTTDGATRNPTRTYTYRSRAVSVAPGEKENDAGVPVGAAAHTDPDPSLRGKFWVLTEQEGGDERRCDSPIAMFSCNGFCRDVTPVAADCNEQDVVKADVVSLASCADSERTFEDKDGKSMTASLVEILRRDPNQSVKQVLTLISHAMYTKALLRHTAAQKVTAWLVRAKNELLKTTPPRQERRSSSFMVPEPEPEWHPPAIAATRTYPAPHKRKRTSRRWLQQKVIELSKGDDAHNELQTPQLTSARPLDMNRQWKM
ncbi:caspase domain-containing protein [Mycena filopes]|nr:caspase domain-containing protein [Mycena filopes]